MAVTVNGERPRILDHTGRPWQDSAGGDGFALAPVLTHSSIINQSMQVYSAIRRDDAIRFGRLDALAMERDCFLQGLMLERYESTALLKWHIEPEDPKDEVQQADAEWHQKILERTPHFQRYKMNLLYAIWFGRSGVQHVINKVRGEEVMGRPVWRVVDHAPVRGDKIEFTYQFKDYGEIQGKYREGMPIIFLYASQAERLRERGATVVRSDQNPGLLLTDGYWRERFVIHKHLTKDYDPYEEPEKQGMIHGFGVRDQIFWYDWVRKEWLANISDFIDQVGKGAQIYPYDASNPANEQKAIEAAQKQSRNTVIVWPVWPGHGGQMLPQVMNVPMTGSQILIELMKHMEEIIERYIIGQSGSARASSSPLGNPGNSDMMAATKYNRIRWDAQNLDETLTEQLLAPLHRWNSPKARYKLFFKSDIKHPDADKMVAAAQNLANMGVGVKKDEVRSHTDFSRPDLTDDTTVPPVADMLAPSGAEQQAFQRQAEADKYQRDSAAQRHEWDMDRMKLELQGVERKHAMHMEQTATEHRLKMELLREQAALYQKVKDKGLDAQEESALYQSFMADLGCRQ